AGVAQAALSKCVVALGEVGVGFQQVVQVLLQEAELPDDLQQLFQQVRLVVQGQRRLRQGEERVEPLFEALEQLGHYHRLVAEVVIEVARGHPQVVGNVVGGDLALASGIEQL